MSTPQEIFSRPPGPPMSILFDPQFPPNYTSEMKICGTFKAYLDVLNVGIRTLTGSDSIDFASVTQSQIDYINQYLAMYGVKVNITHVTKPDWYYFHDAVDCYLRGSTSQLRYQETPVIIKNNMPFWREMLDSQGNYHTQNVRLDDFNQIFYANVDKLNEVYIITFSIALPTYISDILQAFTLER